MENKFKINQAVIVIAEYKVVKTKVMTIHKGNGTTPMYELEGVIKEKSDRSYMADGLLFTENDLFESFDHFLANVKLTDLTGK